MAAPKTALRNLSWICEAVYSNDFRRENTPAPLKIFDDKTSSTQAAIYQCADITNDPKTLIIAFRGTSDKKDVITDLNNEIIEAWVGADVKAHKGFVETAKLVYDAFDELVAPDMSQIWVTGHSLGGAAAHVYARHLLADSAHPNLKVTLVTFGSPETFSEDKDTIENLKKHTDRLHHMRVVNDHDLVVKAQYTNSGLKHHIEPTPLGYSNKQWLFTAFKRMTWSEVPLLLASYVPVLEFLADHSLVAYRAHDLEEVQADAKTVNLWWD